MKSKLPAVVVRALQAERAELMRKRANLTAPIDQEISDLDAHLSQANEVDVLAATGAAKDEIKAISDSTPVKFINQMAMEHCFSTLTLLGGHLTSAELNEAVVTAGIRLRAADPAGRLVQLLSQDERFISIRGLGWTINQPDGVVGATKGADQSEQDGIQ